MLTIIALGVQRLKSFMAITTLADGENVMVRKKNKFRLVNCKEIELQFRTII